MAAPSEAEHTEPHKSALERELADLRHREELLSNILELSDTGLHWIDTDGYIRWASQAQFELLGYTREEYIGHSITEFCADTDVPKALLSKIAGGESVFSDEVTLRCRDGSHRSVRIAGVRTRQRHYGVQATAERALHTSEERYRAFIHNSSEGIWRFEFENPIDPSWSVGEQIARAYDWAYLAECNDAMARMYGHPTAATLIGIRLRDLFVREDPKNDELFRAFIDSGYQLRDAESHERDVAGNDRYFLNSLTGVLERGLLVRAWGTQVDITHQKQVENALRASEERFARFMTHLPGAAWIKDIGGRYVYANREAERVFNTRLEDLLGKTDEEVFQTSTAAQFKANDERALRHSSGIRTTETLAHQDGIHESVVSKFPIPNEEGVPVAVGGIAIDITAERRAQAALLQSQERLDLATSAAKIGTFDWEIQTGKVVWNEQEERLFGLESGSFEGTIEHWASRVHPEDLIEMQSRVTAATAEQRPELTFAFRNMHPDGTCRWIEGAARFIYGEDGSAVRMVGVNVDMTDRREAELALRRLNAELEEFAFAASHDLQEPIRMVHLYTQFLLRRHLPDDPGARQCAKYITMGVTRMEALITDLLAYSQTIHDAEESPRVCALGTALSHASMVLQNALETNNATMTQDDLPMVLGDEGQLAQVFQNLLSNSLKYRDPSRPPVIEIRATKENRQWRISVSDNGIGFESRYADRIFGLFKRLHKDKYPGTGLGLAICKRIIERHGGTIWAESSPGVGSTFHFTLREAPPEVAHT